FLTDVPSVCPGCARGCSTRLGTFRNEIFRVTPRANQAVNRWWICDEGRLWGDRLQAAEGRRLDGPRVVPPAAAGAAPSAAREHDTTGADPWEKALDAAAEALRAAAGRVRVLADPRASLEETWALALVAKTLGAPVHLASHEDGADDELLIRADRAPNARGAGLVLDALAGGARPVAELEAALAAGEVAALLALGPGLVGPVEDEPPSLEPDALARAAARIVIDAHPSALSGAATVLLPATSYGEFDGAYVNFAGRVQHSAAALAPKTDCRPAAATLLDLAARLGANAPVPDALREALSRDVPALAAIDWLDLPAGEGEDIAGADSASRACPATGAATALLAAGVPPAGR
ncbi:MAG: molybdopterin-dependent oxidoreductase, partial [Candidatus Polarisedimenticolia bacterium]